MKNKRVFIISWFYIIGSVILWCVGIAASIVSFYSLKQMSLVESIFLISFCILGTVFLFVALGLVLFQWVVIDEKGIMARSLLSVIRRITWDDVKEVQEISLSYHPLDPKMDWLMFIDKTGEPYYRSAFNVKGKYIKIKANKRNREFLKQLCPNIEFTESYLEDAM